MHVLPLVPHLASGSGDSEPRNTASLSPELLLPPRVYPDVCLRNSKCTEIWKPGNNVLCEDNKISMSKLLFLSHVGRNLKTGD